MTTEEGDREYWEKVAAVLGYRLYAYTGRNSASLIRNDRYQTSLQINGTDGDRIIECQQPLKRT